MLAQHYTNIGPMYWVCYASFPANTSHWPSLGLLLVHHTHPALARGVVFAGMYRVLIAEQFVIVMQYSW